MNDFAILEYLNAGLTHALLLDQKIPETAWEFNGGPKYGEFSMGAYANDLDIAWLEKLLGIQ